MNRFAVVAAALVAAALGCSRSGGGGTPPPADLAPRFAGTWVGTLVRQHPGVQPQSVETSMTITATGVNAIAIQGICPDRSTVPAKVSSKGFEASRFDCLTASGTCPTAYRVERGKGVRDGSILTAEFELSATSCHDTYSSTLQFTGSLPNHAPTLAVTLSPSAPTPSDAITAEVSASDPEGDPLTIVYSWTVDGVAVPGAIGPALAAGVAQDGQEVEVIVTASDGSLTSTAQASVTVSRFSFAASPPQVVELGSPVSFQVAATSTDGTPPGELRLEYGPAGMEVTPAGLVTWEARLPMFDRTLQVGFGVSLADHPRAHWRSSLVVHDGAREQPLYRGGSLLPDGRAQLQVTDLDGDGRSEILVSNPGQIAGVARSEAGYEQRWGLPVPLSYGPPLRAADLDGDGQEEIFYATGQEIVRLDGASHREAARSSGVLDCLELRVADLEPDGVQELICLDRSPLGLGTMTRIVVLDAATLEPRWTTSMIDGLGRTLALGQLDGDPAREIVTSGGYVYDGSTGINEWLWSPGFGLQVDVGDLDGDGVAEIVACGQETVRGFSAERNEQLFDQPLLFCGAVRASDVDGDGAAELLVAQSQVQILTYRYHSHEGTLSPIIAIIGQSSRGALDTGDVDGDGEVEVVFAAGDTSAAALAVGDPMGGAVEWTSPEPWQLGGPFGGARLTSLGAEPSAVLFGVRQSENARSGSRVIAFDPATGRSRASASLTGMVGWTGRSLAMDVTDYDRDGVDEVLLVKEDPGLGSSFMAYDEVAGLAEWTSPASSTNGAGVVVRAADLEGNGPQDLVSITSDGCVVAYDVAARRLLGRSACFGFAADLSVSDLDGAGSPEIVALAGDAVHVLESSGLTAVASADVAGPLALVVGDTDGDGRPEIHVLTGPRDPGWTEPYLLHRFDATLAPLGTVELDTPAQSLFLEDLGAGRKNLVLGVARRRYLEPDPGARLRAIDPRNGKEIWRSPALSGGVPLGSLSYVTIGGTRRIAFGTEWGMYLTR